MARKIEVPEPVAAIPLPSADLILYRFEQTDRALKEISDKIEDLSKSFVTKEEALLKRQEYDKRLDAIDKRFDVHRWYWRAVFSAAALAIFTAIGSLIVRN